MLWLWVMALLMLGGCASLPDASQLLHSYNLFDHAPPKFAGVRGPLSRAQGEEIMQHLEARYGHIDLITRQLAFEQAIDGGPIVLGNQVTLLENGPATYREMFKLMGAAKQSINLETFIFTDDAIGQSFANMLIYKQRQGVQVQVIYDSLGSLSTPQTFFDQMRENGVRVLTFDPVNPLARRFRFGLITHRDHRKLLIVDGKVVITGGINVSGVYESRESTPMFSSSWGSLSPMYSTEPALAWRDTDIEVTGPVVAEYQKLFVQTWYQQHGRPLDMVVMFPHLDRTGDKIVHVIGSTAHGLSVIYITLISAINNAQESVYITDPYFAPDHQMLGALKAAAHRGVDVRLLLPTQTDEPLIASAARSHYDSLMDAGIKINQWDGTMLHAKTAVIDSVWSTVGSSNLDWWSIARNNEINTIILNKAFAAEMTRAFEADLENSQAINPANWDDRPFTEKAHEWMARLVQPLL